MNNDFLLDTNLLVYATDSSFSTFKSILNKYKPRGKKIHDFEIVAIALSYHITQIVTFNSSDFDKIEEITCVVPQ